MGVRTVANWEEKLESDEIITTEKEGSTRKTVLLRGLQRLAREAGILRSHCQIHTVQGGKAPIFQCVYEAEFDDGSKWVGTADCNVDNTTGDFFKYPTAVAESRAEARCLRKALGMHKILAYEELDASPTASPASPKGQIAVNVIGVIEKLCSDRNIDIVDALDECLSKTRAKEIFELSQLTVQEGQQLMEHLNSQPSKRRKSNK